MQKKTGGVDRRFYDILFVSCESCTERTKCSEENTQEIINTSIVLWLKSKTAYRIFVQTHYGQKLRFV